MRTATVFATLAVSALLLGLAAASCGCASSGRDVCGGSGCSGIKVRPAPYVPAPRPVQVVRKQYVVVEEQQPTGCYVPPVAQPAPQPVYVAVRPAPPPVPLPAPQPAPQPCARTVVYEEAPAPRIMYTRPAPPPAPVCTSCYKPAPSCGCQ